MSASAISHSSTRKLKVVYNEEHGITSQKPPNSVTKSKNPGLKFLFY